ncbi:MAG: MBL fold metallo-hydrolase [Bacilli bacterium]|nr:MBL fold metallo-hydrolase [Bacilli bacterium]
MIEIISKGFPYKPEIGCFGYSSCLLIRDKVNILFDTGGYNLRSEIIKIIDQIDCVVISHLHFDHCSNLDLFIDKNIPIYISKKELDYFNNHKKGDIDLFKYFDFIKSDLNIKEVCETTSITEDVKIIYTVGHTPGHISVVLNNDTILAGDSLKTYNDYSDDANYGNAVSKNDYLATKRKIKMNYRTIYPGHDSVIINGMVMDRMKLKEF